MPKELIPLEKNLPRSSCEKQNCGDMGNNVRFIMYKDTPQKDVCCAKVKQKMTKNVHHFAKNVYHLEKGCLMKKSEFC